MKKIIRFILDQIRFVTIDIWRTTIHDEQGRRGYLMLFLKTLVLAIRNFVQGRMPVRASALTYYSVFALIPILAFVIGIARGFGLDSYVSDFLASRFQSQNEMAVLLFGFVENYLQNAKGGIFVGIGLCVLFWSVLKVFSQVEISFNEIWGIKKNRSFVRRFTDYISMMLVVPMLIIIMSGVSLYFKHFITYFDGNYIISPTLTVVLNVMPFVVTWFIFTMIYMIMPNTSVKFPMAAIAGAVACLAFKLFSAIYVYVQTWMTTYNAVYGGLAAIPFLLMFVQITWMIVLFGAEVSFAAQSVRNYEFEKDVKFISQRYYEFMLLSITKIVVKRFENEEKPLTIEEMSMQYRIPLRLATVMVARLCRAGVLIEVMTDKKVEAYQPALDINKITVAKFFDMVDREGQENFRLEALDEFSSVWNYTLGIRKTLMRVGNNMLVKDLENMNSYKMVYRNMTLAIAGAALLSACHVYNESMKENVFLQDYNTPHQTIPFDKIEMADYLPAFKEGIRLHDEEIAAIVANSDAPSFENTIVALERSGKTLSKVQYAFYNLLSAETNEEMDNLSNEISPMETEHSNNITLNAALFGRVKAVYDKKDSLGLTVEEQTLLKKTYDSFVNNGANLSEEQKEEFRELSQKLSLLELQFGQNVLNSTNQYKMVIIDEKDLAGLPNAVRDAAAEKAKAKGVEGWCFDLSYPSYVPFMKYADNRDLRKQLYLAYNTKALGDSLDNRPVVKEIVNLRLQIARLLGNDDYASYVLKRRMAENKENVYHLLNELLDAYKSTAMKEIAEVQEYASSHGADFQIMPWDWSYYSEKLRDEKYSINDELLRPYFELENVKRGVFGLATRLYGLRFVKNTAIPVYHPEVEAYEVFDKDDKFIAVLYTDFHPREGKRSGAWMTEYKCQQVNEKGENERPHISIVMNFTRPTDSLPSLLSMDELTTFIHEFGHSIHGMVANTTYESLAGTNVYRDFVELPSQMLENWAYEKEYLDGFAVHYKTGEPIPADLIQKIRDAANFNVGYATLRQLSFGLLDMAWHTLTTPFEGDVLAFEQEAWKRAQTLPAVDGTCMSVQFNHIFSGGYSAGYYSYKWAEVLDADAFSVFQENGIFDEATATRFRKEILEKGGSEHPMTLYKRFRGQEPTVTPLLKRHGIVK